MQVSIKWLQDYIDFQETPAELADKLTMAGIPVENIIDPGEGLEKVVTGRIDKLDPHTDSDHLQICTINIGKPDTLTIVTGAPNVAEGQIIPVALVGANLPNGKKISKGKLRGVVSMGMLCSAQELGLSIEDLPEEQQTGILILKEDTPVGVPAKDVLGLNDIILEFELTANRADCFSVLGLVREIAAITGNKPHYPDINVTVDGTHNIADKFTLKVEAVDLCRRFSTRMLEDVKIMPSPAWMQDRLQGAGIRPINNVVDVTNFVMLELGNPMHAYDYDKLAGHELVARRAHIGEQVHTLDDSQRIVEREDVLVIADAEKVAGLAGVMGGLETEITENTTTIILECADFDSACIRRTARGMGLTSESSGRFERGIDITNTIRALDRAAQLLQEMGACKVSHGVVDIYPEKKEVVRVKFNVNAINKRLGSTISKEEMLAILAPLGFDVIKQEGLDVEIAVPTWRSDVTLMEDISEEIARMYGFDNIVESLPAGQCMRGGQSPVQNFVDSARKALIQMGMCENISFALMNEASLDKLNVPQDSKLRQAVPIMNPLSEDYPLVRTTLLTSVMDNLVRNLSRKNDDLRLFEIGSVFYPKALPIVELPHEELHIAGVLTGRRYPQSWNNNNDSVDFYDAKAVVEALLEALDISRYNVERGEHYAMHPGKTAVFTKGRDVLVTVGEIHPKVQVAYDLAKPAYLFEVNIPVAMKYIGKGKKYKALPKYPAVSRDLAMLVSTDIAATDIEKAMQKAASQNLVSIKLFDLYTGQQIEEGHKSLAFSLLFQSTHKTLTDEEIDIDITKIMDTLETKFAAKLR